jgi:hypothetical protein
VSTDQIGAFVDELTPVVLVADTRVTNHGFKDGKATVIPAVLERGTAVLVDKYGVPRVKCNCGNPLTKPAPVRGTVRYTGEQWTSFQTNTVIVVQETTTIVETYTIVNIENNTIIERPSGSTGDADTAIDQPAPALTGGTEPPPPPPGPEPQPPPPDDEVTPEQQADYCEALDQYVNAALQFDENATEQEIIDFFVQVITDLTELAPPAVAADWQSISDYYLPKIEAEGVGALFTLEGESPTAAADQRIEDHAASFCGITFDE